MAASEAGRAQHRILRPRAFETVVFKSSRGAFSLRPLMILNAINLDQNDIKQQFCMHFYRKKSVVKFMYSRSMKNYLI